MITLEALITRVEQRLMMAAGLNVQIHAEDGFVEMARTAYNKIALELWLDDYNQFETFTLDGVNGFATTDLQPTITRFADIKAVYYDQDTTPLPRMTWNNNPTMVKRIVINPLQESHASIAKIFQILPKTTTGDIHVVYRTSLLDADWDIGNPEMAIPADPDLMVFAVAYDYLSSDGSNIDDAKKLAGMYAERLKALKQLSWDQPISKRPLDTSSHPNNWEEF